MLRGTVRSARRRTLATYGALLLSGLWHGASWNFVLWGAFHASLLWVYREVTPRIPRSLSLRTTSGKLRRKGSSRASIANAILRIGGLAFSQRSKKCDFMFYVSESIENQSLEGSGGHLLGSNFLRFFKVDSKTCFLLIFGSI